MVLAIVMLVMICVSVVGIAAAIGNLLYQWVRREFYRRPLTAEEQWAEQSQEAMDVTEWAAVYATDFPPVDNIPS